MTDAPDHPGTGDVLLLGPTAGGKTALAIALARSLPGGGECIVADSMQVYRGMTIGTAQPTPSELAVVPHHLCGTVEPSGEAFTVRDWLDRANDAAEGIRSRRRTPILVGGTNLYARAWLEGVFDGPGRDDGLRAELEALSSDALAARLRAVDLPAAERIHRNDRRRMIRAIEVEAVSGRRLSDHQAEWGDSIQGRDGVRVLVLDWPTEALNRRINQRVGAMMESGFLGEVRALREAGGLGTQAIEAVGYRELLAHLEGRIGLDEAVEQIKIRTRRYGKQQRTWLRRFLAVPGTVRLDPVDRSPEELAASAIEALGA
ncbi:MAG: tRNA (adenosine(37)-N6)-dimethylallyltransferase MiaA [Planctomycetota bacterium]|nr:tRNA (adenosine(37)-N6)-dimethylallyltransferase MiaA [Planctomycetota bacterium]